MSDKINNVTRVGSGIGTILWVSGWVLSQGFWSTFFSVIFPPWAWYVTLHALFTYWKVI